MKKLFSSSVILFASTFLLSIAGNAQKTTPDPSLRNAYIIPSTESGNPGADVGTINSKAIKSFNRNYKTSAEVKWNISGELIMASFKENGKQSRVFYRLNGRWLRTIITYEESLLNDDIKDLVNYNYKKFSISSVTEVHEGSIDCYFINIENAREFKQVIVYEGEVFVHQQYRKQ